MENLFPYLQPKAAGKKKLPPYRDVKWDFTADRPVFQNGEPVFVEGLEAVRTWAYCALRTERFLYRIYSRGYGNEIYNLIGKPFILATKAAEAKRYLAECLTVSPYISGVDNISVEFADGRFSVDCTIRTIYGEGGVTINV